MQRQCAFPKPKDRKRLRTVVGVKVYPNGREVCIALTIEGGREYKRRIEAMWYRQFGICCLYGFLEGCPGVLDLREATFEHEDGRGMGGSKRDDRIEKDGTPYNGAAHLNCNGEKGSRFIDFNNRGPSCYSRDVDH